MVHHGRGAIFAGRERELGELTDALRDAVAGRGRVALVAGAPGIGKSRLADELAGRARADGVRVLWGRGWEDAGAPSYWPWVQVLRSYLHAATPDEVRTHLGPGAEDIVQVLPELASLVAEPRARPTDPDAARFRLFDSVAAFLRSAAGDRPLLIVLDDLQAADTPSILLVRFIASQLADARVLLVATYRDLGLTRDHPVAMAVAEIAREPSARVLRLGGLDAAAVGAVVDATVGGALSERAAATICRATGGNPLFVGEAIRLLSAEGGLAVDVDEPDALRIAIPASVHAAIARRLGHLDDLTVETLRLAAVLGPEFRLDVLRRVADLDAPASVEVLDAALDAGVLLAGSGGRGRYRFSHDLIRETLYAELPEIRRLALHRRIASVLEARDDGSSSEHLAELAFHYGQAALGEVAGLAASDDGTIGAKAVDYARRAADAATAALAYEEAARLYRLALAVMAGFPDADEADRVQLLLALGDARTSAGDLDGGREAFADAADLARHRGDAVALARAALGYGGRHQWARVGGDTRLLQLLQDAIVLLGDRDERLQARLLTRISCAWRSSPERFRESDELSGRAVEIARRTGDPATLVYTLIGRCWATWWPDNTEVRLAIAAEMRTIGEAAGRERLADALFMAFLSHSELGRLDEARADVAALEHVVRELRQPTQLWLGLVNTTMMALVEGDFPRVEAALAAEDASTYRTTPGRDEVSARRMHRYLLSRELGVVAREEAVIRRSIDEFPWYPLYRAALVCLLLDAGREAEAQARLADLARDDFAVLYRDSMWLLGISLAAEGCARLGDVEASRVVYAQLAPFAGRHATGHAEGSVGAVDRYLGLLAATLGRLDEAVAHLEEAVVISERAGAPTWAAHARHDLAVVLARRGSAGDAERAAALDSEALDTARSLGMALAAEIEATIPGPEARAPAAGQAIPVGGATFRNEGDVWSIEFGTDAFRVRDSIGMRHLARLLAAPGREVHCLELARPIDAGDAAGPDREAGLAIEADDGAGPRLDAAAIAAYRERIAEIRSDLEEAEAWHDPERVAGLRGEEQALVDELSAAVGLGGRSRPNASASERARISVTRAIRAAMTRIADRSPALDDHFRATIRTGTYCSYTPDPRAPITWRT